jgi:hypothetical protein
MPLAVSFKAIYVPWFMAAFSPKIDMLEIFPERRSSMLAAGDPPASRLHGRLEATSAEEAEVRRDREASNQPSNVGTAVKRHRNLGWRMASLRLSAEQHMRPSLNESWPVTANHMMLDPCVYFGSSTQG